MTMGDSKEMKVQQVGLWVNLGWNSESSGDGGAVQFSTCLASDECSAYSDTELVTSGTRYSFETSGSDHFLHSMILKAQMGRSGQFLSGTWVLGSWRLDSEHLDAEI
jgi:hypothetical protein